MAHSSINFPPILPRPGSFAGSLPSLTDSVGDLESLSRKSSATSFNSFQPTPSIPKLINPQTTDYYLDGLRLVEYTICEKIYTMLQPPNEAVATFTRQTINGRTLSYRLKVCQQPEKARACGSGPRSSADRRPVDPPPVVKLTVFEGNEDITLRYDAGFMLYASLDVARPIANGRMHSGQVVPVLTGVAVAGVAYLERPKPAGYFVFPDLSVRHEGWYRLRFHLFEQVKHAEDADIDRPFETAQASTSEQPREPNSHEAMANRMFVYSCPFQVFSAKKFPGLNTSTELSKVVADQGCRVRIRREIRQRRKVKGKADEEGHRSSHATPEPAVRPVHDRTLSQSSEITRRMSTDQSHMISRRPSVEQISAATPLMGAPSARPPPPASSPIAGPFHSESRMYRPEADSQAYAPVPPHPISGLPRTMTPTKDLGHVTLPPITSLYENQTASARPLQYQLPEPTPQKRAYSPQTYAQDSALKDGARPDSIARSHAQPQPQSLLAHQRSTNTLGWVMNPDTPPASKGGPTIEADNDLYADDSDSEGSILDGPFIYRRADGTKSGKALIVPGY